ncbi:serine hydrolase [Flavisolibacter tropicus]|uniref:Beta-lactamase n=1 Tax=Flavisolibacter tropicus TaxID=1492898 RepID=A0A172TVH3_9BACT|nr:serine hydrolase [Flavisolibacter tropicus]ANE50783.1 beta-lactamase [Flavisolibacter tropicus]
MRKFFFVAVSLISTLGGHAQALSNQQIDALVQRVQKTFDVPGIAVAVVKDGKVVHAKGYGFRSLQTQAPTDENTLFGIASNTKAFTTAALGILIDEGKLHWDDKVVKYIPEFQLYDPWVTKEFTIRDLLTHRSGMGLGAGDLMFFPDSSDFTQKDVIYNLRFLKPVSSFRTKYDYDNNLYIVAGEVVSRVSGQSWEEFVEKRILQPLGMTHSATDFARLKDKSNVTDAHAPVDGQVQVIARHNGKADHPAGAIYSSVADLSKWVMLQLSHGKYGEALDKQLFSETVHEEMWSPQTILPVYSPGRYNTHFLTYGLGFFINDVKGYKQLSHTGGLEGMVSQITMLPELNLGIIVLTNQQEGGAFSSITNQIKDGYLNMPAFDWVALLSDNRKKSLESAKQLTDSIWNEITMVQKQKTTKTNISPYMGTYRDQWFGDVVISVKEGKPWFQSKRSPKLTGELFPYKDHMFIVKWNDRSMDADAFVAFSMDGSGKAKGITMKPVSPLTDFSYDFQDLDLKRIK